MRSEWGCRNNRQMPHIRRYRKFARKSDTKKGRQWPARWSPNRIFKETAAFLKNARKQYLKDGDWTYRPNAPRIAHGMRLQPSSWKSACKSAYKCQRAHPSPHSPLLPREHLKRGMWSSHRRRSRKFGTRSRRLDTTILPTCTWKGICDGERIETTTDVTTCPLSMHMTRSVFESQ